MTLDADIVICTETWLSSNDVNNAFGVEGYNFFRVDRANDSGHGGVAMWSKNKFHAIEVSFPVSNFFEVCAVKLSFPKLLIVGMYLRPGIDVFSFDAFCESFVKTIDDFLNQMPYHNLIVAGDFNQYDRSFLTTQLCLTDIVLSPTRENACLDQIYVDTRVSQFYDLDNIHIGPPIGKSDHRSVFVPATLTTRKRGVTKHVIYDLRMSNVLTFEQRFLAHDFDSFFSCKDIEEKCDLFYAFMKDAMSVIPRRDVYMTSNDAAWMTPFIKYLVNERWKSYRSRNWSAYNSLKVKVSQEIWRAKKNFFLKKSTSVKGLWSYVSMERGSQARDFPLLEDVHSSISDFLNAFNDHFCRTMNVSSEVPDANECLDDSWSPSFDVTDVWQCLSHLPAKATGSDDIPTNLYKKSALILAQPIYDLINECLRQRKFPTAWKTADVIPVPKSRGTTFGDYRPISLLPIPAKIAEKMVILSLRKDITIRLGSNQFGIRKNSSTTHAIIAVHDTLSKHADDTKVGASVFVAFDFSKAFDRIDHQKLIKTIREMRLPFGFVKLIVNYLSDRTQKVRVNGLKSDLRRVTSGVPQGSLLGPYLFGLFIASLRPLRPTTTMVKYVDDISFVAPVRKSSALHDLMNIRTEIDNIVHWSSVNHLTLNSSKTSGIIYSCGRFKDVLSIDSFIRDVNFTSSVRFLGVFLDENLGWRSHVNFIVKKCSQRFYILRRLRSVTSEAQFISIYRGIILSLIEYAAPVFIGLSVTEAKRLNGVQKRCLRIKGIHEAYDLCSRRLERSLSVFKCICNVDTFVKDLLPPFLPSGRPSVPFCRTSLRRSSFIPAVCIKASSTFIS